MKTTPQWRQAAEHYRQLAAYFAGKNERQEHSNLRLAERCEVLADRAEIGAL